MSDKSGEIAFTLSRDTSELARIVPVKQCWLASNRPFLKARKRNARHGVKDSRLNSEVRPLQAPRKTKYNRRQKSGSKRYP